MSVSVSDELFAERKGCGPLLQRGRRSGLPLRQQVFEYVRSQGHAARSDIASSLDVSAGSATTITADLIASGLLQEVDEQSREQGRGRPRVALEVVSTAGYVIGIKLALDVHTAVLVDFNGKVVAEAKLSSRDQPRATPELLDEVDALISGLLPNHSVALHEVHAIGLGLPGIVEHRTGQVIWSSMLHDRNQDLGVLLKDRYGLTIVLDNDANMLTLAELWFGAGRSMADFAVVTIESGVGMGLVLGNEIYRGAHGLGLELGHTKVQLDGALCRCGQRGCLEAYLADYALNREAGAALGHLVGQGSGPEDTLNLLFEQAKSGHEAAQTIFRRAGRFLSVGLANVIQLFDPALIILSGSQMKYDYLYASEIVDDVQKLTLSNGRKPCKVEIHAWDDLIWARGASALALSKVTDSVVGHGVAA